MTKTVESLYPEDPAPVPLKAGDHVRNTLSGKIYVLAGVGPGRTVAAVAMATGKRIGEPTTVDRYGALSVEEARAILGKTLSNWERVEVCVFVASKQPAF